MANIPWGLVVFVVGVLYGALKRGRQDKGALFRQGLVAGVIVAIVIILLGLAVDSQPLGVAAGTAIFLATMITAIVLSLLFILGVWLGDLLTGRR